VKKLPAKPGKKKRRWGNPRKQIERFYRLTRELDLMMAGDAREACWFKEPRRDLMLMPFRRTQNAVYRRKPIAGETMFIHTHPAPPSSPFQALPSPSDLRLAHEDFVHSDIRSWIISRVHGSREIGRTIIKVKKGANENQEIIERNKRTVEEYKKLGERLRELLSQRADKLQKEHEIAEIREKIWGVLQRLEREGSISIRFVPMPGYRFDKEKGDFVKTRTVWSRLKNRIKALKPF